MMEEQRPRRPMKHEGDDTTNNPSSQSRIQLLTQQNIRYTPEEFEYGFLPQEQRRNLDENSEEHQQALYQQLLQGQQPTSAPTAELIPDVLIEFPQLASLELLGLKGYCKTATKCELCVGKYASHLVSESRNDYSCGWDRTVGYCRVIVGGGAEVPIPTGGSNDQVCPTVWQTNPMLKLVRSFGGSFGKRTPMSSEQHDMVNTVNLLTPYQAARVQIVLMNLMLLLVIFYFGRLYCPSYFKIDYDSEEEDDEDEEEDGEEDSATLPTHEEGRSIWSNLGSSSSSRRRNRNDVGGRKEVSVIHESRNKTSNRFVSSQTCDLGWDNGESDNTTTKVKGRHSNFRSLWKQHG